MCGSFEKFSLQIYCLPQTYFNFLSDTSTLGVFSPNTFTNSLLSLSVCNNLTSMKSSILSRCSHIISLQIPKTVISDVTKLSVAVEFPPIAQIAETFS